MQPFFRLISGRIERATQDSAAFDLFSSAEETIFVGDAPVLIPTNVRSEFSPGFVAIMKERSGLGLKGLELKAGVIDADYRGVWGVVARYPLRRLHKLNPATNKFEHWEDPDWQPFAIHPGDKIAQFLLIETAKLEMINGGGEMNFGCAVRGEKGFGSSDRKQS